MEKISDQQQLSTASITSNVSGKTIGWSSAMIFQDQTNSSDMSHLASAISLEHDHTSKNIFLLHSFYKNYKNRNDPCDSYFFFPNLSLEVFLNNSQISKRNEYKIIRD